MTQNNGFLYVGSLTKPYYDAAVMSAESIKDYWPEAKCTLFTHKDWVNETRDNQIFDRIALQEYLLTVEQSYGLLIKHTMIKPVIWMQIHIVSMKI